MSNHLEKYSPKKTFFGSNLAFLREDRGLKQKDFASEIGFKYTRISGWENGNSYPQLTVAMYIADYFKVRLDALFFEDLQAMSEKGSVIEYRPPSAAEMAEFKDELMIGRLE